MVQNLASVVISISLTGMLLGCGGGGTAETMAAAVNTSGLGGAGNANTGTDATGGQGNASTGIFAQNILPSGLAVDEGGNVLVSDPDYNRIQIVDPRGVARTLAGSGQQGSDDGIGSSASFLIPSALAVGMGGKIYVADKNNNRIRYLQPQ